MGNDDRIRLQHMLDAVREIGEFRSGLTQADLKQNRMATLAIIKELEIIGEAAGKVSAQTRAAFPEIPWTDIIGMRNRLIHGYFDVDLERVWDTVTYDLPELQMLLIKILDSFAPRTSE